MALQMRRRRRLERGHSLGVADQISKTGGKGGGISFREGHAAGPDGLGQAASRRGNDDAAAGDAFDSYDPEAFFDGGWDHHQATLIEHVNYGVSGNPAGEMHLLHDSHGFAQRP